MIYVSDHYKIVVIYDRICMHGPKRNYNYIIPRIQRKQTLNELPTKLWSCSHWEDGSLWLLANNIFLLRLHYCDVIMGTVASLITSLSIVYTTVYSDADQSKHQSSASLAFVWGIHRGPVNSPHKWPVTRKMFPFDDVIMKEWAVTYIHSFIRDV